MTTTGLSKYRGLLSALQPKVVLIEEAAETLEAPVTVACMPSVQHLILVGDHLQLRPHTHSNAYEDHPWHLNVSLFERMINNEVEYSTLNEQRRMIPEIRRILYPIYKDIIKDHPSVMDPSNRPDVPGMGVNSFFFTHGWHEDRDDLMSCYNDGEAKMIAGFVEYLIFNGMTEDEITILTFYHGQRKKILSQLRSRYRLQDRRFQVATVDSYQGEENKVVILSLVRSNEKQQIGFLSVENRVCVALSRAQCGFYIFGNGMLLHTTESLYAKPKKIKNVAEDLSVPKVKNKVWTQVITIMAGRGKNKDYIPPNQPIRLAEVFTVRCKNHGCDVKIESPPDWDNIIGGCLKQCEERLPCGHVCSLTCHPFPHDQVLCVICPRGRVASFPEDEYAGDIQDVSNKAKKTKTDHTGTNPSLSASSSWSSFAAAEPKRLQDSVGSLVPAAQRMDPTHLSLDFRNVSLSDRGGAQVGSRGSKGKQKAGPSLESAVSSSSSSNGTSVGDGSRRKWKDKVSIKETVPSTEEASSEPHEENLIDLGF
jgi:helicase required for RNAi-mediated heterochromatin assembly 1